MSNRKVFDYSCVKNLPELLKLLRDNKIPDKEFWIYIGKYQEAKARENGVPMHGTFELTPFCNLDCNMCYVHLNANQVSDENLQTVEQWKRIITKAHSMGMMNATLTGGECLIYPGFDELYLFLREMGIKTSIKTNGVLLSPKRIDFFNKYPPRSVTISLYGSSNEVYKRVTGHEAFDVVYGNLLQLKEAEFPVSIAITPSSDMYEDLDNLFTICKQLGFPYSVNVALFQPREETGRTIYDLSPNEYAEIFNKIKNGAVSPSESYDEHTVPDDSKQVYTCNGLRCGAGKSCFTVEWNGKMSGCDNLDLIKIDLHDEDFSNAWKRINMEANTYPLPVECKDCIYDKVCFSCAAYRGNGAEKGHCNKKICERTKLFVSKGIYKVI